MFWSIPKLWLGANVYVLGGGKSLSSFDFSLLKGRHCVGCNDNYLLGPNIVEFVCFGDVNWFVKFHRDRLRQFKATIVTNNTDPRIDPWVLRCEKTGHALSTSAHALGWFQNTGIMSVELAIKLGAKNIYLLGYDMRLTDGIANYYHNLKNKPDHRVYPGFMNMFKLFEKQRKALYPDVNIVNVNDWSELDLYPKKPMEEFTRELRSARSV